MTSYDRDRYVKTTRTSVSASRYKAPIDGDRDAWAVAVLNLTDEESKRVLAFADEVQKARTVADRMLYTGEAGLPPGWIQRYSEYNNRVEVIDPEGTIYRINEGTRELVLSAAPLGVKVPKGWTQRFNHVQARNEYIDRSGDIYIWDRDIEEMQLVFTRTVSNNYPYRCTNGHAVMDGRAPCAKCAKAAEFDVFGDAELLRQRDAKMAPIDEARREAFKRRQELRAVDPSGRFSGLEIE